MVSRNQPTGLTGLRDARIVPATAYATMNRSGLNSAVMSNASPLRAASTHAAAKPARLIAPTDQATAVRKRFKLTRRTYPGAVPGTVRRPRVGPAQVSAGSRGTTGAGVRVRPTSGDR